MLSGDTTEQYGSEAPMWVLGLEVMRLNCDTWSGALCGLPPGLPLCLAAPHSLAFLPYQLIPTAGSLYLLFPPLRRWTPLGILLPYSAQLFRFLPIWAPPHPSQPGSVASSVFSLPTFLTEKSLIDRQRWQLFAQ